MNGWDMEEIDKEKVAIKGANFTLELMKNSVIVSSPRFVVGMHVLAALCTKNNTAATIVVAQALSITDEYLTHFEEK